MNSETEQKDLPNGWKWATIADLGIIASGGTPSTSINQFWNGKIAWITPADLSGYTGKYIAVGKRNLTELGLEYSGAVMLPKNSLLYSTRAPIGYCVISSDNLSTNQGFKNLIPLQSTFIDYVFYYLQSAKQLILSLASGTTFMELSLTNFSRIRIPLAPLTEQKKIVVKIEEHLSELDNSVKKLSDSLSRLDLHKQLILNNSFNGTATKEFEQKNEDANELIKRVQSDKQHKYNLELKDFKVKLTQWQNGDKTTRRPVRPSRPHEYIEVPGKETIKLPILPPSWKWEKIGNFSFVTKLAGFEFTKFITYSTVGEIPVIKAQNVSKSGFVHSDFSFVSSEVLLDLPRIKMTGGEILFVFVGAGLGNVAIVPTGQQYLLGPNVGLIKPSEYIYNKYVQYFLLSPIGKSNIGSLTKATAQGSISMENIRNILIPICSYAEQKEIVDYIEYQFTIIDHLKTTVNRNLKKAEALKIGILKNAFEGKLVPQSPDDEDASILLARLGREKKDYILAQQTAKKLKPKKRHIMADLKSITEILIEANGPVSAKDLWQESIHKDDIDAFYAELKVLEDKIQVINNEHQALISLIK